MVVLHMLGDCNAPELFESDGDFNAIWGLGRVKAYGRILRGHFGKVRYYLKK